MTEIVIAVLVIGGLTAFILLIRWVISNAVNKGSDAIRNAMVEKRNKEKPNEQENLSDRFRK